jgi:uncharacterized membrane protein YedE/YeeE
MTRPLLPFLSGLLFAVGLALAGMTLPSKVIGFLDVAGRWDPSLAFVMVGAIAVYATAYRLSLRMARPVVATSFAAVPPARIDLRLLVGSALFGVGWGLAGLCPGPALASMGTGSAPMLAFCLAMLGGFWATRRLDERSQRGAARAR